MSIEHFDFLVLGGGSAGYNAAALARKHLPKVAIVDGSEELGGLCILRGCMPSKTLLYAADVLHLASEGHKFGLNIPDPQVDMKALHNRKKQIIGEFASYRRSQIESDRFSLFRQNGRLGPDRTILLDDGKTIRADRILLSTGSEIAVPGVPGLAETPTLTSDDILELDSVPESVIVLGGGIVACELAQFLNRIGTKVTMIQRSPHILSDVEPDMATVLEESLIDEGIDLFTDTKIVNIESKEKRVSVQFLFGGRVEVVQADSLFNALGRKPRTSGLGFETQGIVLRDSGHIQTNECQMTSLDSVYAAGDCTGPHELVHVAIQQAEVAVRHSLGLEPRPVDYDKILSVIFTDPQVASIGPPKKDLEKKFGDSLAVADYPFSDHGRSILMEAKRGYVRLYSNKEDGKIVRAECVGKDAGELIHSMAVAIGTGATVQETLEAPWYHPTLSEIWTYPLEDLAG
ncbi:MAG: NAD(P)/FAD-dependent oxidoreductase [Verrucomicrobiota bacterium]